MDDESARRGREPRYRLLLRAHRPSEVFLRTGAQVQRPSKSRPDEVPRRSDQRPD